MKVAVIDDYQNVVRSLQCFEKLQGFDVAVFHEPARDEAALVEQLKGVDAVILTMQRTAIPRSVLETPPTLKLSSQTGLNPGHIDLAACKERVIIVSAGGSGGPNPTAEMAWALILSALRPLPQEVQGLKEGQREEALV